MQVQNYERRGAVQARRAAARARRGDGRRAAAAAGKPRQAAQHLTWARYIKLLQLNKSALI